MKKTGEEIFTNFNGMTIIQRNDFQNFTLDSVLLGDFVKINRKTKRILDIGTGCGIISIILARKSIAKITGIDIQKIITDIAKRNVKNNNLENKIDIINEDIKNFKNLFPKDTFDVIVTNPPYFEFKGDINQINNLHQLSVARHNIDLTLEDIIKASNYLLKNGGYFYMVFRTERLIEVLEIMRKYKIEPKRLRNIFTKREGNSKISLIEGIKLGEKGLLIENPIFVYDTNGNKCEYVKKLYGN